MNKLLETWDDEQCPYCGGQSKVEHRADPDGQFVLKACCRCAWVKIIDEENQLLSGEARPPESQLRRLGRNRL
jgi:hypothetical protein